MIQLPKENYKLLNKHMSKINFNILFAESVINKNVAGDIFVDNINNPSTFYILHPYGMSLLLGATDNMKFNKRFYDYALNENNTRNSSDWLQVFPDNWNATFQKIFNGKLISYGYNAIETSSIEIHTRVNFKFDINKYISYKDTSNYNQITIERTNKNTFHEMKGTVIPQKFWNNVDDFLNKSIGYSLFYEKKLAATAYAAFTTNKQLEIGIETIEEFRGKGYAQIICSKLIDYCIENNLEPIWSCRKENTGSYMLAKKLGFKPIIEMPFYKLPY